MQLSDQSKHHQLYLSAWIYPIPRKPRPRGSKSYLPMVIVVTAAAIFAAAVTGAAAGAAVPGWRRRAE